MYSDYTLVSPDQDKANIVDEAAALLYHLLKKKLTKEISVRDPVRIRNAIDRFEHYNLPVSYPNSSEVSSPCCLSAVGL